MSEHLTMLKAEFEEVCRELDDDIAAKDATIEDLSRKLEEARGRIAELQKTGQYGETKSEQAYQVIGSLASLANCFEHPEVIRALDYFGSDRFDPEFLPFAVFDATEAPHTLGDMQEPRLKVVK